MDNYLCLYFRKQYEASQIAVRVTVMAPGDAAESVEWVVTGQSQRVRRKLPEGVDAEVDSWLQKGSE